MGVKAMKAVVLALAVGIGLSGCGPTNLQECLQEATTKPTNAGVQLAAAQCRLKFPPPGSGPWDDYAPTVQSPASGSIDEFLGARPAKPAPAASGMFDDLIPKKPVAKRPDILNRTVQGAMGGAALVLIVAAINWFWSWLKRRKGR